MKENRLNVVSKEMRFDILKLALNSGGKAVHLGGCLSMVETMAVLFLEIMDHSGDKFVLSKGHGGLCYYIAMYKAALITEEQLYTFDSDGGDFSTHPLCTSDNGVIFSSGSLGLGISYAAGLAWAKLRKSESGHIYALLGDGEIEEGSVWEAAAFAKQQKLSNFTVIVDCNKMQCEGLCSDINGINQQKVWEAFGWNVVSCDGHNTDELSVALNKKFKNESPVAILAETEKGHGVSFMHDTKKWHSAVLAKNEYDEAVKEIEIFYGN